MKMLPIAFLVVLVNLCFTAGSFVPTNIEGSTERNFFAEAHQAPEVGAEGGTGIDEDELQGLTTALDMRLKRYLRGFLEATPLVNVNNVVASGGGDASSTSAPAPVAAEASRLSKRRVKRGYLSDRRKALKNIKLNKMMQYQKKYKSLKKSQALSAFKLQAKNELGRFRP
ncbi:unnamed protein product [Notodromas monacha]|uniref:Uncharacterized protein n=1 Tax=Notodromas monacha TaxID=399045 RepID=A0A7R9BZT4_9CRUS|nr:unnamed protein product [Notodromas monacha]CAG0923359.1 unnamed protein product [Notodromas monacha]